MCIYLYIINIQSTHTYITAYIMYTKTFILDVINHYSALKLGPCDLRMQKTWTESRNRHKKWNLQFKAECHGICQSLDKLIKSSFFTLKSNRNMD